MSSVYENESPGNSLLASLVQQNAEALEQIERTPYQPIVYAIPQEQREEEFKLLQQAVTFQPELYRRIEPLATKKELQWSLRELQSRQEDFLEQAVDRLTATNQKTVTETRSLLEQAGKAQERFISDSTSALDFKVKELDSEISGLRRLNLWFMIGTMLSSLTLAGFVSVWLPQLLG